jgi:deoxyribonuclease-4
MGGHRTARKPMGGAPTPGRPPLPHEAPLGAHVSVAGGLAKALERAEAIGATAIQIFTKQATRWAERDIDAAERRAWRAGVRRLGLRATTAHDSYLINAASPDPALWRRSVESYVREMRRCVALGLDFLVSHPGNAMGERAPGIERNAEAITEMLARVPGRTVLCLETTAGSGTALGCTFEELATIIELIPGRARRRVAVAADTCHLYAAGYDLVGDFDGVWARFDETLGLDRLRVMHLNDSRTPLGSRRDRHELIGEGTLGTAPFRRIMTDPRFARVAKIIETPKGDDHIAADSRMLALLRSLGR